jgi:hypothetical protein
MGRFYVPPDARVIDEAWRATLEQLEVARLHVTERGGRLVIALYPSVLQIDPRLRSEVIDQLHGQARDGRITPDGIDPRLPNRMLLAYCREHGLAGAGRGTDVLVAAPALRRAERAVDIECRVGEPPGGGGTA